MTWAVGRASRSDLAEVHDQVVKLEKDVTHARESLIELRAGIEKSNDKVQGRLDILSKDAQDALKGLDTRIQALDKALTKLDQAMSDRTRNADHP
jgi:prefoldin subunit 5